MARKLRVAIDCRINDPNQGTGTAVLALAKAFSDSQVKDQEYTFIVRENMKGWLAPYVYGPCKLEGVPESRITSVKAALRWVLPIRFIWKKLRRETKRIPISDGFVEARQFDVVHFPTQLAYLTELPTIYQPHDLQHLHCPQFFSPAETARREELYRVFCNRASYVCVHTEWTKQDVLYHYQLLPERVAVIPWGSVLEAYASSSEEEIRATVEKYSLPSCFFFYPAATWPHKNHKVIFRALRLLKTEHAIAPHVFFTGSSTAYRPALDKLAEELGISQQLHFLGFVSPAELQAIFKTATAMIYPSKFEGFGLPLLEAFHARVPVLSSNSTTLPEVAADGALYFNPDSPAELAGLMKDILERPELRQDLIRKGTSVLSRYSFSDTAASFQALYERTVELSSRNPRPSPMPATV